MLISCYTTIFLWTIVASIVYISTSALQPNEIAVLEDIYNSTNGDGWAWSPGDVRWNFSGDPDPCSAGWYGIACSDFGGKLHLSAVELQQFNLNGTIPSSLSTLAYLGSLSLYGNSLRGTIPAELGNLSSLQTLYLWENALIGTIPEALGNLTALQRLDLDSNALTGSIPPRLGALTSLLLLDLSLNAIYGTLPAALGNLVALQALYLFSNALTGPIPEAVSGLTALTELILTDNVLSGTVPAALSALSRLQLLRLDGNLLTGTIPSSLVALQDLLFLDLAGNRLKGTIPSALGSLRALQQLYLFSNALTGTVPASLGQLPALLVLYLTLNQLSGPIPAALGSLGYLQALDLHYNALTGTVPGGLQQLTNLTHIDISYNALSGTIPAGFADFTLLQQIGMDDNAFTGTLSALGAGHAALQLIQFENNLLTGTIPDTYAQLAAAENLMLSKNYLTGTLPQGLAGLAQLQGVYAAHNLLTGCLPAFGRLANLQILKLSRNAFECTLEAVFNSTEQTQLVQVEVDHNALVGSLPAELFRLPALSTVVALVNCFTGTLPADVCGQVHMMSLVLDGLHAAPACQRRISALSHSYAVSDGFHGSIPPCVFSLPALLSLHLSGNGLTGSMPSAMALGEEFLEMTLSHNALTGTVPAAVQAHPWAQLDLSYNLLTGTLDPSFGSALQPNASTQRFVPHTVYVQNNRLSGRIPSPLVALKNVSVLGSNIFSCGGTPDRAELPTHDSGRANYECGSDAFDGPFYALLSIVAGAAALLCWARCAEKSGALLAEAHAHFRHWAVAVESFPPSCQLVLQGAAVLFRVGAVGALAVVLVLVPWYAAASRYYGTYAHQYAWVVSAAFLSGLAPGLTEYFLFTLLITAVTVYAVSQSTALEARTSVGADIDASSKTRAVVYAAFLAANLTVVLGVNVAFVSVALTQSHSAQTATQVLLASFKLFWNAVCMPRLVSAANAYLGRPDMSAAFFAVQAFVGLFNNIAIPCLVVAVLSPSCFYSVFDTPPTVSSDYVAQAWYFQGDAGTSGFTPVRAVSQYDPPFSYDYQCSSSFVTYYAPTFVYMAITASAVVPLAHAAMVRVHSGAAPGSARHRVLTAALPRHLQPVGGGSTAASSAKNFFKGSQLLVTLVTYLGILLTFGVVFPPLAAAMCLTMLSSVGQVRLGLGRLLHNAGASEAPRVAQEIERECAGVASAEKLRCGLALTLCFASCFYPLFLFDTIGSDEGFRGAYWVLIVMPLTPLVLLAGFLLWRQQTGSDHGSLNRDKIDATQGEGADNHVSPGIELVQQADQEHGAVCPGHVVTVSAIHNL